MLFSNLLSHTDVVWKFTFYVIKSDAFLFVSERGSLVVHLFCSHTLIYTNLLFTQTSSPLHGQFSWWFLLGD